MRVARCRTGFKHPSESVSDDEKNRQPDFGLGCVEYIE